MSQRKHTPEQIISKLPFGFAQGGEPAEPREAEVELARGATVGQVCKKIGVSDHTYYRWRAEYGGMRVDQAKRLTELILAPVGGPWRRDELMVLAAEACQARRQAGEQGTEEALPQEQA